ncbi:MAG: PAS domain S-box protein [Desulfobacterota bacterium]|nr:PAS domain S-box protein [Thermodesulfobacteriota bacterium]
MHDTNAQVTVDNPTSQPAAEGNPHDRYFHIIQNANDAIIIFSRDGTILEINPKAQQLFGYAPHELVGQRFSILVPEDKREAQEQAWQQFIVAGQLDAVNRVFQGMFRHRDGSPLPIELSFSFESSERNGTVAAIIRDVSERHRFEAALQRHADELEHEVAARTRELAGSEERYRMLIDTAPDAILSVDTTSTITLCNKKAEMLFSYARDSLIGMPIAAVVAEDVYKVLQQRLHHGETPDPGAPIESTGKRSNGTVFPAEYTIAVVDKDGSAEATLFVRDITVRKNLERELQEYMLRLEEKVRARTYELTASQQNLKEKVAELSVLKEVNEALSSAMELDEVLHIILVGATSHHGFGFNRAFIFLVSDDGTFLEGRVAIGPSDSAEAQRIWSEIIGKNYTLSEILRSYTTKNGRVDSYVNSIIRQIKVPLDRRDHILAHVVAARESVNVRDAHMHPLVPSDMISLMNCNAFALIPLIAEDTVLGVLWADNAITNKPIDEHDIEQLRSFAVNASLAIQKSNLIKSIRSKVEELDRANRELKESRDLLVRSERLAAIGEMSARVAHGLRNPLVSIGGFARRLLKREPPDSPNRKYLQIIVDEIDRLEHILIELLDFVRPRPLQLQQVALHRLLEESLTMFATELEQRGIQVVRDLRAQEPCLEIDGEQIARVVQTLIRNAFDAMPEGGVLTLRTAGENGMIRISVADTRTEIPDDDLDKIFHPDVAGRSGSGLGLAVCNQIVSLHGGSMKARRAEPCGMVFDLYLPDTESQMTCTG